MKPGKLYKANNALFQNDIWFACFESFPGIIEDSYSDDIYALKPEESPVFLCVEPRSTPTNVLCGTFSGFASAFHFSSDAEWEWGNDIGVLEKIVKEQKSIDGWICFVDNKYVWISWLDAKHMFQVGEEEEEEEEKEDRD
jgi:hypothetical protein